MIYGFTGTRQTEKLNRAMLSGFVRKLHPADEYVTGACRGIDAVVATMLIGYFPDAKHTVIVPSNHSIVEFWWERIRCCPVNVIQMPEGTSYKDRNQAIVDRCDELVGFPELPENHLDSRRSGSWQTIRMARRAGKIGNPEKVYIIKKPQEIIS